MKKAIWILIFNALSWNLYAQIVPADGAKKNDIKKHFAQEYEQINLIPDKEHRKYAEALFYLRNIRMPQPRNYKVAQKILGNLNETYMDSIRLPLFRIHFVGGYEAEKNPEEAQRLLAEICANEAESRKTFLDAHDLNLCDIDTLTQQAQDANPTAQMQLSRLFTAFELDLIHAEHWAQEATKNGHPDGQFWLDYYTLRYRDSLQTPALGKLLKKHLDRSPAAMLQYAKHFVTDYATAKQVVTPILTANFATPHALEEYIKAQLILYELATQEQPLRILRELHEKTKNTSFVQYKYIVKPLAKFYQMDSVMHKLTGFLHILQTYQVNTLPFEVQIVDYQNNFGGDYVKLLRLYQALTASENVSLFGQQNLENYRSEIQDKLVEILHHISDAPSIFNFVKILSQYAQMLDDVEAQNFRELMYKKLSLHIQSSNDLTNVIDLYRVIQEDTVQIILGKDTEKYRQLVAMQCEKLIHQDDIRSWALHRKWFEIDPFKQKILPHYPTVFQAAYHQNSKQNPEDSTYHTVLVELDFFAYQNFTATRPIYDSLQRITHLQTQPNRLKKAQKTLVQNVVKALYGDTPNYHEIKALHDSLAQYTWLNPEGKSIYLDYLENYWKKQILNQHFYSLDDAKLYQQKLAQNPDNKAIREILQSLVAEQALQNIYGNAPTSPQIQTLRTALDGVHRWLGQTGENQYYRYLIQLLYQEWEHIRFTNWTYPKHLADSLAQTPIPKPVLRECMKKLEDKALYDMYGKNPSLSDIKQIPLKTRQAGWKITDDSETYFQFMNDSYYRFTNYQHKIYPKHHQNFHFFYVAERPEDKPSWSFKVMQVERDANEIFEGKIWVKNQGDSLYIVTIPYIRKLGGVNVQIVPQNYLVIHYPKTDAPITPILEGNIIPKELKSFQGHGYTEQELRQKNTQEAFTELAALRCALRYFILKYGLTIWQH